MGALLGFKTQRWVLGSTSSQVFNKNPDLDPISPTGRSRGQTKKRDEINSETIFNEIKN